MHAHNSDVKHYQQSMLVHALATLIVDKLHHYTLFDKSKLQQ